MGIVVNRTEDESDDEDDIADFMLTDEFQKLFQDEVNKSTWDIGLPKVYCNQEGKIVHHWKDGRIDIIS